MTDPNCIFCKIVVGNIPAYKVAETDKAMAFLDLHPIRPGHALVIPKIHTSNFQDLDEIYYLPMMQLVQRVAKKIKVALKPPRVGIMTMGWEVPHAHVHVVPMMEHGDITSKVILEKTLGVPTAEELAKTAHLLS